MRQLGWSRLGFGQESAAEAARKGCWGPLKRALGEGVGGRNPGPPVCVCRAHEGCAPQGVNLALLFEFVLHD